jgi:hypothetical protein
MAQSDQLDVATIGRIRNEGFNQSQVIYSTHARNCPPLAWR